MVLNIKKTRKNFVSENRALLFMTSHWNVLVLGAKLGHCYKLGHWKFGMCLHNPSTFYWLRDKKKGS